MVAESKANCPFPEAMQRAAQSALDQPDRFFDSAAVMIRRALLQQPVHQAMSTGVPGRVEKIAAKAIYAVYAGATMYCVLGRTVQQLDDRPEDDFALADTNAVSAVAPQWPLRYEGATNAFMSRMASAYLRSRRSLEASGATDHLSQAFTALTAHNPAIVAMMAKAATVSGDRHMQQQWVGRPPDMNSGQGEGYIDACNSLQWLLMGIMAHKKGEGNMPGNYVVDHAEILARFATINHRAFEKAVPPAAAVHRALGRGEPAVVSADALTGYDTIFSASNAGQLTPAYPSIQDTPWRTPAGCGGVIPLSSPEADGAVASFMANIGMENASPDKHSCVELLIGIGSVVADKTLFHEPVKMYE